MTHYLQNRYGRQWSLHLWIVLWCLGGVFSSACAADIPVIRVLHNSFVTAEKFQKIVPIAAAAGITLESVNIETSKTDATQWFANAQLIIIDTPRPGDRAMLQTALEQQLQNNTVPAITIGGGPPVFTGIAPWIAGPLTRYYATGGARNFAHFFTVFNTWQSSGATGALPPVEVVAATGFYHPDVPAVFNTIDTYLLWAQEHMRLQHRTVVGTVGFVTYQGAVTDMATAQIDTLIRQSEQAGLIPVVFWFDANDPAGLPGVLGQDKVDVLVNLTHMQQGAARSADFVRLDIPVIQTTRFREGTLSEWASAASGINARSTAVFLAVPEGWGMSDPIVLSAQDNDVDTLLPAQVDVLIGKAAMLAKLRHTAAQDKKLALLFWNYPLGEKNLAASNMNVPRSIVSITTALAEAGYQVTPPDEAAVIRTGQRLLGALYRTVSLSDLLFDNLAALFPVSDYEAWVATLPQQRQNEIAHWGNPARHWAVRTIDGERYFVIPRWQIGNLLIMPQMPRSDNVGDHYHDMHSAPDHLYLASYLYLQRQYAANALIHLGTHGTQEWLPGKDRGLAAHDYSFLTAGNLPVFYPYIQDNIGEAIQAKRRGRAVAISHQTPPFVPAGLYDQLRDLHHLIHEYMQLDDGAVKDRSRNEIITAAVAANMHADLGFTKKAITRDFEVFLDQLHDHMHELARVAMPIGLHTFGQPASDDARLSTVMQQLGRPFYDALGEDAEELFGDDFSTLKETEPYETLTRYLRNNAPLSAFPAVLHPFLQQAAIYDRNLQHTGESEALLAALAGRFVAPGIGGDPIRTPDVPSGRNLYAFDADKIPAQAAYMAGGEAFRQLVGAYRNAHGGAYPKKLAFSLWSSEAIRHLGVTESQVLHALGVQPVWDKGARLVGLDIIPVRDLGRPRVDVVVQVTSVYRDQFDSFMRMLANAITRIAQLDEPDNLLAANNQRIAHRLQAQGVSIQEAARVANYRIFSSAPGAYGTGLPDMALQSTRWGNDSVLAERFLASGQYAYGSDSWGESLNQANLFAEQLKGVQAAVMSRSSNVHGVLSTDHPFEFLGGLSLAVRHLDGQAPALFISDLRTSETKTTSLARFLSDEMRVRYLNPQWIQGMQREGYAGTLQVLNVTNNLFGWKVTDPSTVRDDQWQALFDTYVTDTRNLGINTWFEKHNPTAQAQVLERMAEAIRKDYWDATDDTKRALVERWQKLEAQHDVFLGESQTRAFINALAEGFGLQAGAAPAQAIANVPPPAVQTTPAVAPQAAPTMTDIATIARAAETVQTVQGQVLEQADIKDATPQDDDDARWARWIMLLLLLLGAVWQAWHNFTLRKNITQQQE